MSTASIVIPLYNKGQYIGRALNSVFNQTFQDFDVVVVDGGSDDDGPKVVSRCEDPRVRFLLQEGEGVSSARNEGIQAAKSDFIAFLDADDVWFPEHLQSLLRLRQKYPEAGAFASAYLVRSPDGMVRSIHVKRIPPPPWEGLLPEYLTAAIHSDQPVWTSAVGIPRQVLASIGGFPQHVHVGEDLITWFKIALRYPIAFTWNFGAVYHMESENRTTDLANAMRWEEDLLEEVQQTLHRERIPVDRAHAVRQHTPGYQISAALKAIYLGDLHKARRLLQECDTRMFRWKRMKYMLIASLPSPLLYRCLVR